jgi:hypothetical protein
MTALGQAITSLPFCPSALAFTLDAPSAPKATMIPEARRASGAGHGAGPMPWSAAACAWGHAIIASPRALTAHAMETWSWARCTARISVVACSTGSPARAAK